ncbi:MAG TPA: rod shape-determining protein MreD [Peptostreptococcaceae bacterium]|nr:rod shape-determining protein MreD [Peptostreptococcaceae bacterium]
MKKFILFLIGILILILENSVFNYIDIFGNSVNIILIYISIISLYLDELEAGILGAVLGLLKDLTVGTILGTNGLSLFIIAYVFSFLRDKIYKESLTSIAILVILASMTDSLINIVLLGQIYANYGVMYIISNGLFLIPILNTLCSVIFYLIFKDLILKLKKE